jgi:hypothetical protein
MGDIISDIDFQGRHKRSPEDFTRSRKLGFKSIIQFMLKSCKNTLAAELVKFANYLGHTEEVVTKSAFSQARQKLKHTAFIELNDLHNKCFYQDGNVQTFKSHRLLAIDGSYIMLPDHPSLKEHFGVHKQQGKETYPMGRGSIFWDVCNRVIVDSTLETFKGCERKMTLHHLKKCKPGDLVIFDRGYPAHWLFSFMEQKGVFFVAKIPSTFHKNIYDDLMAGKASEYKKRIDKLGAIPRSKAEKAGINFTPYTLRYIKLTPEKRKPFVIVTNYPEHQSLSHEDFAEIYRLRWDVEEAYKHLKCNMELENFTGKTPEAIYQDFYIHTLINNIQTMVEREAQPEINNKTKHRKYRYKANRRLGYAFLKEKILDILWNPDCDKWKELTQLFTIEPVAIKPNRLNPRKKNWYKSRLHMTKKRAV